MTEIPLNLNAKTQDVKMCEYILIVVSKYLNVPMNFHLTRNRKSELVYARQMSMLMMKKHTKLSLTQIGECFERDHATVLYGIRHINNLIDSDKLVRKQVYDVDQIIQYRAKAMVKQVDLNQDYYYIDFNDFTSVRFSGSKGILLTGFTTEEIDELLKYMPQIQTRVHTNSGMYILEPKNIDNNERKDL